MGASVAGLPAQVASPSALPGAREAVPVAGVRRVVQGERIGKEQAAR